MSANEENLDGIEPEALERLKRTVLEQIEAIGTKPGTQEDKIAWAGRIKAWFDLLKEIETKIENFKKGS